MNLQFYQSDRRKKGRLYGQIPYNKKTQFGGQFLGAFSRKEAYLTAGSGVGITLQTVTGNQVARAGVSFFVPLRVLRLTPVICPGSILITLF